MTPSEVIVAGTDAGSECIKVVVLTGEHKILGRAIVPTRGNFQDCIQEAMGAALDEAHLPAKALRAVGVTGFGATCAPVASVTCSDASCHALGAYHQFRQPMTVVDIGGREPRVIEVDDNGRTRRSLTVRRCAVGIGTFLMFAARHLDVHPTRLMDLASSAVKPAPVGSYCSVFAEVEVLELLRAGHTAADIALGCMHSIAERILEMGGLKDPVVITGGVCEYFPAVARALGERSGLTVRVAADPIFAGAIGAALLSMDNLDDGPA